MKLALALLCAPAVAFMAPAQQTAGVVMYGNGKYDDKLWDMAAKKDVWGEWDPNSPRSDMNFNPFERDVNGNGPDCSGYFPGQGKYKDPQRPSVDFASMMAEKEVMAEIEANPKDGDKPGAPGCL